MLRRVIQLGTTTPPLAAFILMGLYPEGTFQVALTLRPRTLALYLQLRNEAQLKPDVREIQQSPLYQGIGEAIAWPVDVSAWVSGPTAPVVKIYRASDNTDLSSTLLSGSATVSGDVITCPLLSGLTLGVKYRLGVKFTVGTNVFEAWAWVWGQ